MSFSKRNHASPGIIFDNEKETEMKIVIQRVLSASVEIEGKTVGKIGKGYLVLLGIGHEDDEKTCDRFLSKLLKMRIFEDENGKTNLSLFDVSGELLIVSQFTLYADLKGQNRPGFTKAAGPEEAERLYDYFVCEARKSVQKVETGEFGADMKVSLTNDGPFTIVLDETQV